VTRGEVEEIKGHFDGVAAGLRTELKQHVEEQIGGLRTELRAEIGEVQRHVGVVAEDLRSEIRAVAEGVALANERINQVDLRVDGLTVEMRRGFAGVRAEMRSFHEADDELRRRIEAQEQRGA
jgi:hypothetical protein